eukprot:s107_g50.t1
MCVALVDTVLQFTAERGLTLREQSLDADTNPLVASRRAQVAAGQQPRGSKLPPMVADFASVAVFLADELTQVPCALMSKLDKPIDLRTKGGLMATVPKYSRFLRFSSLSSSQKRESEGQPTKKAKGDLSEASGAPNMEDEKLADSSFEVVFGLPWTNEGFIEQACKVGHPAARDMGVPTDLEAAVRKNVEWSNLQMCNYRIAWCRKWMTRAKESAKRRRPAVAEPTSGKRILLAREMLKDAKYEDIEALSLLQRGATLAGEVEASAAFDNQFKPCLITLQQPESDALRRNEMVMRLICSSGSEETDMQMLEETELELERGWAEGPFELDSLEPGATISRRFPLVQSSKPRMIDDFSVSGREKVEIYRMRTMPFGATHSVYCFLRLARCIYALVVRGLFLLTTNFHDDFILASQPGLTESSKNNSMELLFMLTGWLFSKDGKKATDFDACCKALAFQFDFSRAEQRLLAVSNTEARKRELVQQLQAALDVGKLDKQECLVLRGRLGFADSFLHGRLGRLVLKKLIDHAYGNTSALSVELRQSLQAMVIRLQHDKPKTVSVQSFSQ